MCCFVCLLVCLFVCSILFYKEDCVLVVFCVVRRTVSEFSSVLCCCLFVIRRTVLVLFCVIACVFAGVFVCLLVCLLVCIRRTVYTMHFVYGHVWLLVCLFLLNK